MIHFGDITKRHGYDMPAVDVVTGGSPCQDLSVAGRREGFEGERSVLFLDQIRIIKEMREKDARNGISAVELRRPRYMLWENVPGAFSSRNGEDFKAVLEETIKVAEPEIPPLSVPEKGWPNTGLIYDEMGGWSVAWRVHDARYWGVPQRRRRIALVADFAGLSAGEILFERKGLCRHSSEDEREESFTARRNSDGAGAEDCRGHYYQQRRRDPIINGSLDKTVGTLNTLDRHAVVSNIGSETYASLSCCDLVKQHNNQTNTKPEEHFVFQKQPVYSAGHYYHFTNAKKEEIDTLAATDYKDPNKVYVPQGGRYIARRITPLECERLQGFPDSWTDIGKWIDSKGKMRKTTDAMRYKALGNSIALPYWKVLARKIAAQYDRDITMGSLFDGIAGFPIAFMHVGATCLWTCEIDDFPRAVVKYHFGGEDAD